jgi:hypothetical protein
MDDWQWKPGDPPDHKAARLLMALRATKADHCQFCAKRGSEECWQGLPAHTRCLDAEPPLSAGERAAQQPQDTED